MRLMLLGDAIDGREAARIGLVLKAVEPDEFEAAAAELTAQISTMATRSYGIVKQQIVEQLDLPFRAALAHSMAVRQTNVIEDREEGARAFLEKRQPNYKGR